jgi:Holliday junction resolvase RusA-like endonuclease
MTAPFTVEFTFEGEPITKSNNTKCYRGRMVTAKKPAQYESDLSWYAKVVMSSKRLEPTKKLVRLTIHYYHQSVKKKDQPNLPKTTADALNRIVYEDDSQIHETHLYRHLDRQKPRVVIKVEEVEDMLWVTLKKSRSRK